MAIDYTLLFDRIRAIGAALTVHDGISGDIDTTVNAVLAEYSDDTQAVDSYRYVNSVVNSATMVKSMTSLPSSLVSLMGSEVVRQVKADDSSFTGSTDQAITRLVAAMVADSESVDACTTGVSVSSESGTAKLLASVVQADGTPTERVFAETVVVSVTNSSTLKFSAPVAKSALKGEWPGGSGITKSLSVSAVGGLVSNGSFDAVSTVETGYPDEWDIITGVVGTSIKQTAYSTQTITLSSDPTEGWYSITLTDSSGNVLTTEPLAFDATSSDVETAITALGWVVSVEESGTAPNLVHTITFEQAGTPSTVTIHNETDGTITPAAGTSVDTGGLTGLALILVGDGSELTKIQQPLTLAASTVYAFTVRLKRESGTSGAIRFRLVDGANSVIADDAGTDNTVSKDVSTVATSGFDWVTAFFRTPSTLPAVVKLELALTTALTSTKKLYVDDLTLVAATQWGTTGAWLALVAGESTIPADAAYALSFTNDRAGTIQTRFVRHFNRQLPSDNGGTETISD